MEPSGLFLEIIKIDLGLGKVGTTSRVLVLPTCYLDDSLSLTLNLSLGTHSPYNIHVSELHQGQSSSHAISFLFFAFLLLFGMKLLAKPLSISN